MKMEIGFQEFKKAIILVDHVAGKHMTLPVLSCLLFDIKKNFLTIKATNLDIGVEIIIPIKSDKEEQIAIPSSVLSSFISQISDYEGTVKIELVSGNLQINTIKSKGIVKTVPHEDFPSIPTVQNGQKTVISPSMIVKGLRAVWYSASVSSVKPELSSVYIYSKDNQLVFTSTDSFRLAEKKIQLSSKSTIGDILIPFKNVGHIIRLLESFSDSVDLEISKNLISFEIANKIKVTSRAIDGVFPDYKQIIPKSYITEVILLKQDLLGALKVSNVFSDKFNQIHLTIDPKAKIFEIQTKNNDIGENRTTVDAAITGEKMEINFNYKYIVDCFQSVESDSMSLQLSGSNRPMVIRPVSGDQSFMYLVMPMNR